MYDLSGCRMRRSRLFAAFATLAVSLVVDAARVSFERVVPAPHDLSGAEDLAVIYAIGDDETISTFLSVFLDQANRSGTLRVHDVTRLGRSLASAPGDAALKGFRRRFGAQRYLRVTAFSCRSERLAGEGSAADVDGKRVRRKQHWIDAVCTARIEVVDPDSFAVLSAFNARGEGTSPRVLDLTKEERDVAVDQAAHYAGVAAAEEIAPRRLREIIVLDETAPGFSDALAMIEADRFPEARRIWDVVAVKEPSSAPLHFNLATVCEAMGDIPAAQEHYREAARLVPRSLRYRNELEMFRRRYGLKQ